MSITNVVMNRRSIRAFTGRMPEISLIESVISRARWAPSWGNTQPWQVTVVTGAILDKCKSKNRELAMSGRVPDPDVPMPGDWPERYRSRYRDVGKRTLGSQGIARDDAEARKAFMGQMMEFFQAPCLLILTTDGKLALEYAMLDLGAFMQTLCLIAHDEGLGTCILAAAAQYPQELRNIVGMPEGKTIVAGIALGYPEAEAPVNSFERTRAPLDEFVAWVGTGGG